MQLAQVVHRLNGGGRLDEERGAAGRLVVHDAADLRATFPADRDAVAAVADRDRGVGYGDPLRQSPRQRLEGSDQVAADRANGTAQPLELGGGGILERLAVLVKRFLQ